MYGLSFHIVEKFCSVGYRSFSFLIFGLLEEILLLKVVEEDSNNVFGFTFLPFIIP